MKGLVLAVTAAVALFAAPQAFAEDVTVTLTGVEARGGNILAALQTEGQFMQPAGAYGARAAAPSANGDVTLTFTGVAPGAYALVVMHDENGDNEMQREPNGRPLEGWAMSNGALVNTLRAAPTFAQVSVNVAEEPVSLTEPMFYRH
jgi:uncharacterized protein (DUF2141 family)